MRSRNELSDTEKRLRDELKDSSEQKIFDGLNEIYNKNFDYVFGMCEKEYRKSDYTEEYDEDAIRADAIERTLVTSLLEVATKFQDSKVGKLNEDDALDYMNLDVEDYGNIVKGNIKARTHEEASKSFIKDVMLPTYENLVRDGHRHDTVVSTLFSILTKADGACNEPFDIVPYYEVGDPQCNIPYKSTCINVANGGIHEYLFPVLGEESEVYRINSKAEVDDRKPLRDIFSESYKKDKEHRESLINPTRYYLVRGEDLVNSDIELCDINDMGIDHDKIIAGMELNGIEFTKGDDE